MTKTRGSILPDLLALIEQSKITDDCLTLDGWKRRVLHRGTTATRVMWAMVHGDPGELWVLHTCHNEGCLNLRHLYLGDHDQNMRDMKDAGRANNGQRAKTHCPSDHEYTAENTYTDKRGRRTCRKCQQRRCREYETRRPPRHRASA